MFFTFHQPCITFKCDSLLKDKVMSGPVGKIDYGAAPVISESHFNLISLSSGVEKRLNAKFAEIRESGGSIGTVDFLQNDGSYIYANYSLNDGVVIIDFVDMELTIRQNESGGKIHIDEGSEGKLEAIVNGNLRR
jgi:hypothetical protein